MRTFLTYILLLIIILCSIYIQPSVTLAQNFEPVYSTNGMVAGPEKHAVQSGVKILQKGGNAFDAAISVAFALAVTYPQAGNIGGGGFLVGHTDNQEAIFLDYREVAPIKATRDMYQDENGNLINGLSTETVLATGVPGTVHGLYKLWEQYGSLEWKVLLQDAIQLADQGFPMPYTLAESLKYKASYLTRFESTADVFYPNGQSPEFGENFVQKDLAATLRLIRDYGPKGFYEGETADKLVTFMQKHNGIITHEDLVNYQSKFRDPIIFNYKNHTMITPNLPSSGGITLAQIFHFLEHLNLQSMGHNSASYTNALVEAERLAFADRNHFLGDIDFVNVPLDTLLSNEYLEERRKQIPLNHSGDSQQVSHGDINNWSPESPETTHFCVVDKNHNVAAITTTLNASFGMGAIVEGAGFFLNNEMDDLSAKPGEANLYGLVQGEANAIQPGKRPLSSMTPTIVLQDGKFQFTTGTPGGPTIITTNLQVILNKIEFDMNIRMAIDAYRFHHQWLPDIITHETLTFSNDTTNQLESMGYNLRSQSQIGLSAGIELLPNGVLAGHADARMDGWTEGY